MKKKAILIFSDLDGTIFPIPGKYISQFAEKIKVLQDKENAQIKFVAITGRNQGHTRAQMQQLKSDLEEAGVTNPIDFAFSEQGAGMIDGNSQILDTYVGKQKYQYLKDHLRQLFNKSSFSKYYDQCDINKYNSAFVMKKNLPDSVTKTGKENIKKAFLKFLEKNVGKTMNIHASGVIEVTPTDITKVIAIEKTLQMYRKQYNISGIIYCGDASNDLPAIRYVSGLSAGTGIKTYVYTPLNAKAELESKVVEKWKDNLFPKVKKVIRKARLKEGEKEVSAKNLRGIIKCLDEGLKKDSFVGTGLDSIKQNDDWHINYLMNSNKKIKTPIKKSHSFVL